MSTFYILDNSLINNCFKVSCTDDGTILNPMQNILGGSKWLPFIASEGIPSIEFIFSCSNNETVNYFYLANAQLLPSNTAYTLYTSSDGSTWAQQVTKTITPLSNGGFIDTFNALSSKYYKLKISHSIEQTFKIAQVYLGALFDLGKEPTDYPISEDYRDATFTSDAGSDFIYQVDKPRTTLSLSFDGITDALAQEFEDRICPYVNKQNFVLYSPTYTQVLGGKTVLECQVTTAEKNIVEAISDFNQIKLEAIELL